MVSPIVPLLIKAFSVEGRPAMNSGLTFALMGLMAGISAYFAGRLARTISLKKILLFSCIGTGLLYLPPLSAGSVVQLAIFMGVTGLLTGGIITASSSLVSLSVPINQQGIAYGLSQSANSLGSGLGPLIGGSLAPIIGLKPVFAATSGLFVLVGILIMRLMRGRN